MIIRVLIAVVLAVPAYFYTMRYNMHMLSLITSDAADE